MNLFSVLLGAFVAPSGLTLSKKTTKIMNQAALKDQSLAKTPPMGWNSWDAYSWAINESELLETAKLMSSKLSSLGYNYIVIDGGWMSPLEKPTDKPFDECSIMDACGRYIPDPGRFPSSGGGVGFKKIAEQVHALGLKFGIHMLRGVSREAVKAKLPILGTKMTFADIADPTSTCGWNNMMFGAKANMEASQAWYDSQFALWASWDVDFIKMDDISSPYHKAEIEMMARAAKKCGRPMLLSLSPGDDSPIQHAEHVSENSHMWRISGDYWDKWSDLRTNMDRLAIWAPYAKIGAWPDPDMLPLGNIKADGSTLAPTRFTRPEQISMFTLWCISRSPLILGPQLQSLDDWTLGIITNKELIDLNQKGADAREAFRDGPLIVWRSQVGSASYVAVFNTDDKPSSRPVNLARVGAVGNEAVDVWKKEALPVVHGSASPEIEPHGCVLIRVTNGPITGRKS